MNKKVVIIGAGLAGSLLCNELVKSCNVALLERGSRDSIRFPQIQFLNKVFGGVKTFCYGGGGTTNLWHNGLIPINLNDLTDEYFKEALAESEPFMDNAASALFFEGLSFTEEYKKIVAEVNSLSEMFSVFEEGIDCLIYPGKYQKLTVDPKVDCAYDVKDINFIFEGDKIRAVEYSAAGGKKTIDAHIVVVSAGSLGTPGIVQKIISGTGAAGKAGIGFMDHPMGFVGKVKFKKDVSHAVRKLASCDKASYTGRSAVRLKSDCGRYTSGVFFRQALSMTNNLNIYKYKSSLGASKGIDRLKNAFSLKLFHPDILAEIYSHVFGRNLPGRTYNILFIADQKRGHGSVSNDDHNLRINWSISDKEISVYQNMLVRLKEMLTGLADEINIKTDISEAWLWSAAHHSGTTSMGYADSDLIDKNLKLKCCANAFVCDASVIQEHSYANTGLAIGQLALRLAARIQDNVQK